MVEIGIGGELVDETPIFHLSPIILSGARSMLVSLIDFVVAYRLRNTFLSLIFIQHHKFAGTTGMAVMGDDLASIKNNRNNVFDRRVSTK